MPGSRVARALSVQKEPCGYGSASMSDASFRYEFVSDQTLQAHSIIGEQSMRAKVVGGSFGAVDSANINVDWNGKLKDIELREKNLIICTLLPVHVKSISLLSEQDKKSFLQKAAAGAIGGFAFGGAGLIAGALAAGNKRTILALVSFKDDRSCVMDLDDKAFRAILSSVKF